jgi:putative dehydrogenase
MSHHAVSGFAARLSDEGITLVDAPVTGGKAGADAGTLTAISAGPDIALQRLAPVYEPYTTKRYVVGPTPGAATIVKMVNQLLMGVHLTAAAEALNLAMGAGADPELARNVILDGAGFSRAFESRSKAMIAGEHDTVRGAVDIFVKDLGLVTELAKAHDLPTPLADAALEQFQSAAKNGLGRKDCAAVISVYQSTKRT